MAKLTLISARQMADLRLPEMPKTREGCSRWIAALHAGNPAMTAPRPGKGGGLLVDTRALPAAARLALKSSLPALLDRADPIALPRIDLPHTNDCTIAHFEKKRRAIARHPREQRPIRHRLLLAELVLRATLKGRVSLPAIVHGVAETICSGDLDRQSGLIFPASIEPLVFEFNAPFDELWTSRVGEFFGAPKTMTYEQANRMIAQERALRMISRTDLTLLLRRGAWRRRSDGSLRDLRAVTALLYKYLEELRVPSTVGALSRYEYEYNTIGSVGAPVIVSLARAGYLSGVPLTLDGLRKAIQRRGGDVAAFSVKLTVNLFWGFLGSSVTSDPVFSLQIRAS